MKARRYGLGKQFPHCMYTLNSKTCVDFLAKTNDN